MYVPPARAIASSGRWLRLAVPLVIVCVTAYASLRPAFVSAVLGWTAVALLIPTYLAAYILLGELTYEWLPKTMSLDFRQAIARAVGILLGAMPPLLAAVVLAKELLE
jgi:hypothetical protein